MTLLNSRKGQPLLGNFEENILNNRLQPVRTVDGYTAEVRASGHFQPKPLSSRVRVSFFIAGNSYPYISHIPLPDRRGYRIPKKGTLQVTLFNPLGTLVKLFLLFHDLNDMPPNSQTFLRQRTIFVPCCNENHHSNNSVPAKQQVCYLIHMNIVSSKSGRIYLNKDLRIFISKKVDLEVVSQLNKDNYELKSYVEMPENPKYFTR